MPNFEAETRVRGLTLSLEIRKRRRGLVYLFIGFCLGYILFSII